METRINEQSGNVTISFSGRFDTAAYPEASKAIEPYLDKADRLIVIDCSELEYISSSGLRTFITIRKASHAKGGKVQIKGMNNTIRSVFMMTGFLNLFEIVQ